MAIDPFEQYSDSREYYLSGESEAHSLGNVSGRIDKIIYRRRRRRVLQLITIGAAAFLLLFIGNRYLLNPDIPERAESFFEPYPNYVTASTRGSDTGPDEAYAAYDQGRYSDAVSSFGEGTLSVLDSFYLAVSLQAVGEWEKSEAVLTGLDQRLPAEYEAAREWYLALALLAGGDEHASTEILEQIRSGNSGFQDDAKRLLRAIQ